MKNLKKAIIAYVPVLHQGYLRFFSSQKEVGITTWYLIGDELKLELEPQLRKDIRALTAAQIKQMLEVLFPEVTIGILEKDALKSLSPNEITLPDEDLSHVLVETYLKETTVSFLPISLRWDSSKTTAKEEVYSDTVVTLPKLEKVFMSQAYAEAEKSLDWWRRVGAVVAKDGKTILKARNQHVPSPQEPYFAGDPRANFHKGVNIELGTALHAEASIITQAAEQGISLKNADLYVTTFPCPTCAKLIAHSGFKRVYYQEGYSMVAGAEVMKSKGIELIKVTADSPV